MVGFFVYQYIPIKPIFSAVSIKSEGVQCDLRGVKNESGTKYRLKISHGKTQNIDNDNIYI